MLFLLSPSALVHSLLVCFSPTSARSVVSEKEKRSSQTTRHMLLHYKHGTKDIIGEAEVLEEQ